MKEFLIIAILAMLTIFSGCAASSSVKQIGNNRYRVMGETSVMFKDASLAMDAWEQKAIETCPQGYRVIDTEYVKTQSKSRPNYYVGIIECE